MIDHDGRRYDFARLHRHVPQLNNLVWLVDSEAIQRDLQAQQAQIQALASLASAAGTPIAGVDVPQIPGMPMPGALPIPMATAAAGSTSEMMPVLPVSAAMAAMPMPVVGLPAPLGPDGQPLPPGGINASTGLRLGLPMPVAMTAGAAMPIMSAAGPSLQLPASAALQGVQPAPSPSAAAAGAQPPSSAAALPSASPRLTNGAASAGFGAGVSVSSAGGIPGIDIRSQASSQLPAIHAPVQPPMPPPVPTGPVVTVPPAQPPPVVDLGQFKDDYDEWTKSKMNELLEGLMKHPTKGENNDVAASHPPPAPPLQLVVCSSVRSSSPVFA